MKLRMLVLGLIVCAIVSLWGQEAAKQKLLAQRAAELDAYRKLAEYVKGLQISARTYVRDFVCESDEIHAAFRTFIRGAKTTAVRHFEDGTCEVDMEMEIERIITELETIKKRVYKGDRWKDVVFQDIKKYVETKTLTVTGSGVVRESLLNDEKAQNEFVSRTPSRATPWSGIEVWEKAHPRDRLMAQRGAEADAYRKLAEYVMGLEIRGETKVKDFVTESDEIRTAFNHFIKGVQITNYNYNPDGTVEAEAEIELERIVTELETIKKRIYQGDRWKDVVFQDIKKRVERKIVKAVGVAVLGGKYTPEQSGPGVEGPKPGAGTEKPSIPAPEWANRTIKATGTGVPPEEAESKEHAQLLAEKAAERHAQSKLAEEIYGLKVEAETTVKDFVTQSDVVKTEINKALVVGAKQIDKKVNPDGTVEVTLEIDLRIVWRAIEKHIQALKKSEEKK
ncbi:MAG: hypothetical protein N2234_07655 [Planctomycetota bacterium]|nr:hypothetical protein [Planctomycetota bacterium]